VETRQVNESRPAAPRRHIIERPRLTRLLTDAEARIILLVAPAGYGKTTLARQWLSDKPHVWHNSTASSADVAALASRLADAARSLTDVDVNGVDRRIQLSRNPEQEAEVFAELIGGCFSESPSNAWLAIDDYHLLMDSSSAETLIEALTKSAPINLLVTSRRRPSWASARQIMYGEICELGRSEMAMDASEADEVLQGHARQVAAGLKGLADGWPAVVGMAALARVEVAPEGIMIDEALYEFFAEDVLNTVEPETQEVLHRLAVLPEIKLEACQGLFGEAGLIHIRRAERLGLLSRAGEDSYMHPLLRRFLLMKYRERNLNDLQATASKAFDLALASRDFDSAFTLAIEFAMPESLEVLIRVGVENLLAVGRMATLRNWVDAATNFGVGSPVVGIAEAEVAFREGDHVRAEALATASADELLGDDPLRARGLFRSGQAAYFRENYDEALSRFDSAVSATPDQALQREVRWAAFVAALDSPNADAVEHLDAFAQVREPTFNDAVRMANAGLMIGIRRRGVTEALAAHAQAVHLVDRATDPMIRTAFWNTYGYASALNSRYDQALRAAAKELEEAKTSRLAFVEPHAHLVTALAAIGMRDLSTGESSLKSVFAFGRRLEDAFLLVTGSAVLARLRIARGDCFGAVEATSSFEASADAILYAECLAVRAMSLAALGKNDEARTAIADLPHRRSHAEAQAFEELANLIIARNESDDVTFADDSFASIRALGQFDALVTAIRAYPLLIELAVHSGHGDLVGELLGRSNDLDLARRYGLEPRPTVTPDVSVLSARETEVLDLVAGGRTNEEVAAVLFISPVTVKAHLRHIYEKLGVRNRVEAAARLKTLGRKLEE
jgi:ATP/maltotriose-dependent transcriptional regulator MalT